LERLFRVIANSIINRRGLIIIIGLILVAVSLFGATRITLDTGNDTWLSPDSQIAKDFDRFNEHFGGQAVIVLVSGDSLQDLLQQENLEAMEYIENQMVADPNVISAIGPAYLIKQAVARQGGLPVLPDDPSSILAIVTDIQTGEIRPEFAGVFPDDSHALIPIVLEGGTSPEEDKMVVEATESVVASAGFIDVDPVVTGEPALTGKLEDLVSNSMRTMLIIALVLMFIILALIFKSRGFFAWRWLAMGEVGVGILYTFGAMGLLGIPMTMITMAVFPIVIGLGVDYTIQLHNRYDEEIGRKESVADAIVASITHIGPSMGIAVIAMCLGFAAMSFSPVPMIRDLGLMLIIGVVSCYIVALFLPLTILYWRDSRLFNKPLPKRKRKKIKTERIGFVERGLQYLAPLVIKNPAIIIPIAIALTTAGFVADHYVDTETDASNFISEDVSVMRDYKLLDEVGGRVGSTSILIEADDVTEPEVLSCMVQLEQRIKNNLGDYVESITSISSLIMDANGGGIPESSNQVKHYLNGLPEQLKTNLISSDNSAANLIVGLKGFDMQQMKDVLEQLDDYTADLPDTIDTVVTGQPIIDIELLEGMGGGRTLITTMGALFIFAGLLLFFKFNVLRAFLATLPIALIIGLSSGVIFLSGLKYSPLTATLGALILAIGVEYTILIIMRYNEEKSKGEKPVEAMTTAVTKIGRAIIASSLTDMGGFAALLAAGGFLIVRDFGLMTLINVFLALVSTLVVLPPLVVWVDSVREKFRPPAIINVSSQDK